MYNRYQVTYQVTITRVAVIESLGYSCVSKFMPLKLDQKLLPRNQENTGSDFQFFVQ